MNISKVENLSLTEYKDFLKNSSFKELSSLKEELDDIYYNTGETTFPDSRYDLLKDKLEKDEKYIPKVGSKIREGDNRVKLPYWLGSADKITSKDPNKLDIFLRKNVCSSYVISEKLDGVSCLYHKKGNKVSLFTRGDGIIGADISYLSSHINIPNIDEKEIYIRGELIMKKNTFEEKYKNTSVNGRTYKNIRNMVSGLISGKTLRKGLDDVDFVAYEIISNRESDTQEEQLILLKKLGFITAKFSVVKNVTMNNLEKLFLKFKDNSNYELDGIVIQTNCRYERNIDGNPDYMFAFKMNTEENIVETEVLGIEWNTSKWGQLKPVVLIDPVDVCGVTISRVTAHNAKYIEENNLGIGSIIRVTRSNDVIPYIVDVVKSTEASFPDCEYEWDKNHVNIVILNDSSNDVCIKLLSSFFSKIGVKFLSEATLDKLFKSGFNNLFKILEASEKDLMTVPGIHEKSAKRIVENIREGLNNSKISTVLGASSLLGYGIGEKRIDLLLHHIPDILSSYKKKSKEKLIKDIENIEGFSTITATLIAENIEGGAKFINKLSKFTNFKEEVKISSEFQGKTFVFSGFRDSALEEEIAKRGGKVSGSVSKKTECLVVQSKNEDTTKVKSAVKNSIPIYTLTEFLKKYKLK